MSSILTAQRTGSYTKRRAVIRQIPEASHRGQGDEGMEYSRTPLVAGRKRTLSDVGDSEREVKKGRTDASRSATRTTERDQVNSGEDSDATSPSSALLHLLAPSLGFGNKQTAAHSPDARVGMVEDGRYVYKHDAVRLEGIAEELRRAAEELGAAGKKAREVRRQRSEWMPPSSFE
ncbi:hypothetical protein LTR36_008917 [Oleoguttula mirabilis]|uniref:Uncharacterized protein n=1 Tax=Oleoguttula mirabilis TaxID=1507867 RepID=A0AAV9J6X4_9PEZI|nr:hypothetical protein LTR36_008917 [Oleoguttula mirabilis]